MEVVEFDASVLLLRAARRTAGYVCAARPHEASYGWNELLQGLTARASTCSVRVREGSIGSGWWREVEGVEVVDEKTTSAAGHEDEEKEEEEGALVVVVGDEEEDELRTNRAITVEDWCRLDPRPILKKLVVTSAERSTMRQFAKSRRIRGASTVVAVQDCASLSRLLQRESLRSRTITGLDVRPVLVCVALSPRRRANYLGRGMMPLLFGDGGITGSCEDDACIAYTMVGVDGAGIEEVADAMDACDVVVMHRPIDGLERVPTPFSSSSSAQGGRARAPEGTGSASTIGDTRWQFAASTSTLHVRIARLAAHRANSIFILDQPHLMWQLLDRERMTTILRDMPRFTSGSACMRGATSVRVDAFGECALAAALDAGLASQRPIFIKPLLAAGARESHTMSIVEAVDALATISAFPDAADTRSAELPCPALIQEFVPHDGVVHKVYAIGDNMHLAVRHSVRDASVHACSTTSSLASVSRRDDMNDDGRDTQKCTFSGTGGVSERRWQMITFNSQQSLPAIFVDRAPKRRQPEASIEEDAMSRPHRLPDVALIRRALSWMCSRTQLSVLGMDVVIDAVTGDHVIVDVNSMPSFSDVDAASAGASLARLFVSAAAARRVQPQPEWELVGEGAANVVVRRRQYLGVDSIITEECNAMQGKVLRLRKLFSNKSDGIIARKDEDDAVARVDAAIWSRYGVEGDTAAARARSFATHVLMPSLRAVRKADMALLSRGIDVVVEAGELLELPQEVVARIECDIRAASRCGSKRIHKLCSTALRLTDWTLIHSRRRSTSQTGMGTVCVELKAKGALLPSAGTQKDHLCFDRVDDIKKTVLKYTLMANYKRRRTTYNPMMLFANDDTSRKRALDALIATPNNNLRISVDGRCVFPHADATDATSHEEFNCIDGLRDALHAAGVTVANEGTCVVDALKDGIVHALRESAVLEWLLQLQRLDRVDTVGAAALFKDMLHSLGGTTSEHVMPDRVPRLYDLSADKKAHLLSDWLIALWASDASIMISFSSRILGEASSGTCANVAVVDIDVKPSKKAMENFALEQRALEFMRRTGSVSSSPPLIRTPRPLDDDDDDATRQCQ